MKLTILLAALAVAACSPSATLRPSTSTVPPASPAETATVTPSPTSIGGAMELTASTTTPLAPGTYTRSGFEPRITFALETADWYGVQLLTGFFDVQQDVGAPDVVAVQFARPSSLFGAGGGEVQLTEASAAEAVLRQNPGLTVVEASASKLGGLDGRVIVVENSTVDSARVMQVPPGPLSILKGRKLWIAVFDTPSGVLAIMVGGSIANWDAALLAAEPVLESIHIG